jgi:hypothetical protein
MERDLTDLEREFIALGKALNAFSAARDEEARAALSLAAHMQYGRLAVLVARAAGGTGMRLLDEARS